MQPRESKHVARTHRRVGIFYFARKLTLVAYRQRREHRTHLVAEAAPLVQADNLFAQRKGTHAQRRLHPPRLFPRIDWQIGSARNTFYIKKFFVIKLTGIASILRIFYLDRESNLLADGKILGLDAVGQIKIAEARETAAQRVAILAREHRQALCGLVAHAWRLKKIGAERSLRLAPTRLHGDCILVPHNRPNGKHRRHHRSTEKQAEPLEKERERSKQCECQKQQQPHVERDRTQ